jgi:hypothetical protein
MAVPRTAVGRADLLLLGKYLFDERVVRQSTFVNDNKLLRRILSR